ncbi:MAG TPA: hypothetical protein VHL58_05920 [Thermoanaerobaculia bacterium]|nr:hypothetical protein [Thermoanaerobaculia bacterium]
MKHEDSDETEDDDMLPEYDFSQGVRGKYYEAYKKGTNVVLLEADVFEVFKDSVSVNSALRQYITEHGPPSSHKAG